MRFITSILVLSALVFISAEATSAQWVPTNGPYGGYVQCFETTPDPSGSGGSYIFAGTAGGGILRSTDYGSSWTASNVGLTKSPVRAFATVSAPGGATYLFAGTDVGVFVSTNYGANWSQSGSPYLQVNAFAVTRDPVGHTCLFAGTYSEGVLETTDFGATWNGATFGIGTTFIRSLFASPDTGGTGTYHLYAGTQDGLFMSNNNGATWSEIDSGMTNKEVHSITALTDSSGTTLFAATMEGLFLSTNGGLKWSSVNTYFGSTHFYSLAVSRGVGGSSVAQVFAGTYGGGIYESTNKGKTWTAMNGGLLNYWDYDVAVCSDTNGTKLFAGTEGGIYVSTGLSSWVEANNGLNCPDVWAIDVTSLGAASGSVNIVAGTSGSGVFMSTDNGTTWNEINGGLGGGYEKYVHAIAVSPSSDGIKGVNLFAGTVAGVYRSTNNGVSWTQTNNGLTNGLVWSFAVCPPLSGTCRAPSIIVGTYGGVYLSTNNGDYWYPIILKNTDYRALLLSTDSAGNNTLLAGNDAGIDIFSYDGTRWSQVSSSLEGRWTYSLASSPNGSGGKNIYAGTDAGVFISTDNGMTWNQSGLTSGSIMGLAVTADKTDPSGHVDIFAGALENGVYLSTDYGATWTGMSSGMTSSAVRALAASGTNVFAGADGGYISRFPLPGQTFWQVPKTTLVAPTVDSTVAADSVKLIWDSVDPEASYRVQMAYDSDFTQIFYDTISVLDTSIQVLFAPHDTISYWRVSAKLAGYGGGWSHVWHFTAHAYPNIAVNPNAGNFGMVGLHTTRLDTIVITNSAVTPLRVDSMYTGTTWFKVKPTSGFATNVSPLEVTVTFTPDSVGTYVDTLRVLNNSENTVVTVLLSGSSPAPVLAMNTAMVIFGQVAIGDSADHQFKVTDRSLSRLQITGVSVSTPYFMPVVSLPDTVNAGDTLSIHVWFKPTAYGTFVDTLSVRSSGGRAQIIMVGYSPSVAVATTVSSLDLGKSVVSQTAEETLGIADTSVNLLKIDSLFTSTSYFKVTSPKLPIALAKGDTVTVKVSFTPDSARAFTDTLYVLNNSPLTIIKIPLQGVGTPATGVEVVGSGIPNHFDLSQNYPNSFNPSTMINYQLPKSAHVALKLYDVLGREVKTLIDEEEKPGYYRITLNGSTLSSGIYFYRIEAGDYRASKKVLLLK